VIPTLAPGAEPAGSGRSIPRFPKVARESRGPAAEAATTGGSTGSDGGAMAGRGRSSAEAPTGGHSWKSYAEEVSK